MASCKWKCIFAKIDAVMSQNQLATPVLIELYEKEIQTVRNEIGMEWYFSGAGVLRNVAMSWVEIGEYTTAIRIMEEAPSFPDLAVVMLATGLHALRAGDTRHAHEMLGEVEARLEQWMNNDLDPGYGEVFSGLGALNYRLGRLTIANEWWKKAAAALEDPGLEGIVYDYRIPYAHACWEAGQHNWAMDVLLAGEADFEATLKADYFVRIISELLRMQQHTTVDRVLAFFAEEGEGWTILEPAIRNALAADDLEAADYLASHADDDMLEATELVVEYLVESEHETISEARIRKELAGAGTEDARTTWLFWLAKVVGKACEPEVKAEYQLMMDAGRAEADFDYLSEANAHLAGACAAIGQLDWAWNCVTALASADNQIAAAIRLSATVAETEGMAAAMPHFEKALVLASEEPDPDFQLISRAKVIAEMGARGLQEVAAGLFSSLRKEAHDLLENEFVLEAVVQAQLHAGDLQGALDTLLSVPAEVENGALYETVAVATCEQEGLEAALGIIQRMPLVVERMLAAGNCLQAAADVENFHWGWAPKEKTDD